MLPFRPPSRKGRGSCFQLKMHLFVILETQKQKDLMERRTSSESAEETAF